MTYEEVKLKKVCRKKLLDIGLDKDFFGMTLKTQAPKAKINKWDDLKPSSFCRAKETNKIKKQHTKCEKIFANYSHYRRLISKIYKEVIQVYIK
jgi:hypothetical protein